MAGDAVPIAAVVAGVAIMGMITKATVAITRSWMEHRRGVGAGGPEVLAAIDTLREQVDQLQQQLAETQERLEFTERLMIRDRSGAPGEGA